MIQRSGQHHALLLAAGKKRAHVADQAVVSHPIGIRMISSWMPAVLAQVCIHSVERLVEAADVVGNGSRQELVVLHQNPDLIAESPDAELSQRHAIDQDIAGGRLKETKHDLNDRFSAARWAGDRDVLSGRNGETCVLKYERPIQYYFGMKALGLRSRPVPFRSHQ